MLEVLDLILENWYFISVKHFVECPTCPKQEHMYRPKQLQKHALKGKTRVKCNGVATPLSDLTPELMPASDYKVFSMDQVFRGDKIGAGSYGNVYLVKSPLFDSTMVLKETMVDTVEALKEVQWEVYIMSLLDHPNCISLGGVIEGGKGIVMERCDQPLHRFLQEGECLDYAILSEKLLLLSLPEARPGPR